MSPTNSSKHKTNRPVVVLLDRSRDYHAAAGLLGLQPDDAYRVTDNHMPLRARMLKLHDVLVIAGHSAAPHSAREADAIVRFVRRGGGLLLAASAGVFERYSGLHAGQMAVNAIAQRFGVEFLSPKDAVGRHTPDHELVDGYPGPDVRIHKAPSMDGVHLQCVCLNRWSPVQASARSTMLLSHRRTGEAAALAIRCGKGRVVAVGSADFFPGWEEHPILCKRLIGYLAAGGPAGARPGRLPDVIGTPMRTRRAGNMEFFYAPSVEPRVAAVVRIARKVLPAVDKWAGKKGKWRIELVPSCGSRWNSTGVNMSDAELAFALGRSIGAEHIVRFNPMSRMLHESVLGGIALQHCVGIAAMRRAGFRKEAALLAEQFEQDSRRRFKGLDAGFYYPHGADSPGFWMWQELARHHGDDILLRFLKAIPKKFDFMAAPNVLFTPLDVNIHFLGKVTGKDLYAWFAEHGATVHRLPRERFGSKAFARQLRRYLIRLIGDKKASASERNAALEAFMVRDDVESRPLREAARLLESHRAAERVAGAARLAEARDERGKDVLRAVAKSNGDPGLAAIAALVLLQRGERDVAGRLASLALGLDHRFQLDAGHWLSQVGHPRASRFSFDGIRKADGPEAARMDVQYGHDVRMFPTLNGAHVANIFSGGGIGHMPDNTHVSRFGVWWVHTDAKFRRMGLARLAMEKTFEVARARGASCATLGTGTRNTAHALYRCFGFVDERMGEFLVCDLKATGRAERMRGLAVRPYRSGDETAMARLFNHCYADSFEAGRKRPSHLSPQVISLLAHRGRRLVGYVLGYPGEGELWVDELAVAPGKKREQVAAALMTAFHRRLLRRGIKKVTSYRTTETLAPLLQPLGYRVQKSGGVGMFALVDLPKFLQEMTPLLERRLQKSDWIGTVSILGERHRAGLAIRGPKVTALRKAPRRADITLEGSDKAITQIMCGVHTPFEPYLQLDLRVSPALNDQILKVLETLFPKVPRYW